MKAVLDLAEKQFIYAHACLPEQLPWYLEPMGDLEAHWQEPFVYYYRARALSFIGYPLGQNGGSATLLRALQEVLSRFAVDYLLLMAPQLPSGLPGRRLDPVAEDEYWFIDLNRFSPPAKVRNMVRRAEREVEVRIGRRLGGSHRQLLRHFCRRLSFKPEEAGFYQRLPYYVNRCSTAYPIEAWHGRGRLWPGRFGLHGSTTRVIEAWRDGKLLAYSVLELGTAKYGFYLFNITGDEARQVPGVSDLLLHHLLQLARDEGKSLINLGLGVNEGVRGFKAKWGVHERLPYRFALLDLRDRSGDSG